MKRLMNMTDDHWHAFLLILEFLMIEHDVRCDDDTLFICIWRFVCLSFGVFISRWGLFFFALVTRLFP